MEGIIHIVSSRNYSFVAGDDKCLYFLHHSNIMKGADRLAVGQRVSFDVMAPLPTKKHPMAINAIVGPSESTNNGGTRS